MALNYSIPASGVVINIQQAWPFRPSVAINGQPWMPGMLPQGSQQLLQQGFSPFGQPNQNRADQFQQGNPNPAFGPYHSQQNPFSLSYTSPLSGVSSGIGQQQQGNGMSGFQPSQQLQQLYQWALKEQHEAELARMFYMNLASNNNQQLQQRNNAPFWLPSTLPDMMGQMTPASMTQGGMMPAFSMPGMGSPFTNPYASPVAYSMIGMPPGMQQNLPMAGPMPMMPPMGMMLLSPNMMPPEMMNSGGMGMPFSLQGQSGPNQGQGQNFFPPIPMMMPPMGMTPDMGMTQPPQSSMGTPPWMQAPMALNMPNGMPGSMETNGFQQSGGMPTGSMLDPMSGQMPNSNGLLGNTPTGMQTQGMVEGLSPFPNALPQNQLPQLPTNPGGQSTHTQPTSPEEAPVVGPQPQPAPQQPSAAQAQNPQSNPIQPQHPTQDPTQGMAAPQNAQPQPGQPPIAPPPSPQPAPQAQQPQPDPTTPADANAPQSLEEFPLYQQLSQKSTEELQTLLRDILSIPNEQGQINQLSDPNLYSLQAIEFILFTLRNRPDAATPATYGLLKQLKDMGLVMATINDPNIEDWKKKDSEVILMEALWAAAKLDSFQPPTVPLTKLPGYSTMIEPILNGQEKVPPLILMAAVQAVSPDMFSRYNDVPKKVLTDLQERLTKDVRKAGTRKWWTLGLTKYPPLTDEEKAIYLQTRDLIGLVLNGASLNSLPGMAPSGGGLPGATPGGTMTSPTVMTPTATPTMPGQPIPGMPPTPEMPMPGPAPMPGLPGGEFPPMSPDELQQLINSLPPDQQAALQQMQNELLSMPPEQLAALASQVDPNLLAGMALGGMAPADIAPPPNSARAAVPQGSPLPPGGGMIPGPGIPNAPAPNQPAPVSGNQPQINVAA